jgi:subtilisin family serine protease
VVVAALALCAAAAGAAAAVSPDPQAEGDFCADAPADVDTRIVGAVNALGAGTTDTAPIAVLDTGVDGNVPELRGRIVAPFDALSGSSDASDLDGHGTEVAGIAAGSPGLLRGVSPASPIMPVRIFNRLGDSSTQAVVGGINWAVDHGASVINISSSSPAADASAADIAALTRAVTDAFNRGVIVVTSAGNEGTSQADLPAVLPHILVVGASTLAQTRATFSNAGPWVDLVAPAASLVAPSPAAFCPNGFAVANGTSFAAPAVAGAVALLAQLRPGLSTQQRFDLIRTSATDLDPAGRDNETGFGMLNVQKALTATPAPPQSSQEIDDDPFYLRGPFAARHPTLLTKSKKVRLTGQVSPAKDPADVYKVRLQKNERLVASATAKGADSLVFLGLWKPAVGDFDVTNEVTKQQIVSSGGFSATPELKMRVKKSGTYYISVEAPDAVDEDDPTAVIPASMPYQLVVSKTKLKTRPPAPTKHSKKR